MVNTGPPLHSLESTAPEGRTVYISNVPYHVGETELQVLHVLCAAGVVCDARQCVVCDARQCSRQSPSAFCGVQLRSRDGSPMLRVIRVY